MNKNSIGLAETPDSKTKKAENLKKEYKAYFINLVDVGACNGKPVFIVKKDGELIIRSKYRTKKGKIYVPPPKRALPWLLPRAEEVIRYYNARNVESIEVLDRELFEDLVRYHKSVSELPGEEYYEFLAAWDMHTYLLERVQYSPIVCFFAVPERGKSRTGKGMVYVAWRGVHVESLNPAFIFRMAEQTGATIFFDCMDLWEKAKKSGGTDIILLRFEKGITVPRVLYPDKGEFKDTVFYKVFGPTIIGTNEILHHILDTRAIQINMPGTNKRFDNDIKPEDGRELKERLVAFRARHLYEPLPEILKPANGRLGDIMRPILQIIRIVHPEKEKSFFKLLNDIKNQKEAENSNSLEAKIMRAVHSLKRDVKNGYLSVKEITTKVNIEQPDRFKYSDAKIGRCLSALGFQKGKTGTGTSAILWDEDLINRLMAQYGLNPSEPPEF